MDYTAAQLQTHGPIFVSQTVHTTNLTKPSGFSCITANWKQAAFICLLACVSVLTENPCSAQLDQNTVRYIGEVLVGTEFGGKKDLVSMRWETQPRLSTFGPASHHPAVIKKVVSQLNECLPTSLAIKQLKPNDASANLKVYFVPFSDFEKVANENGFENLTGNWGYFRVTWNRNYEIYKSVVLIANDKLSGNRLQHFVLEEITQSLGMAGDSPRFADSIFYENEADPRRNGRFGTATKLNALDRKLIRFLYRHVPPGTPPIEIGLRLSENWDR